MYFSLGVQAAETSASTTLSFTIPPVVMITPITSPVLVANITDSTGNLNTPLSTKFRVIQNTGDKKTLYLKSEVITSGGTEQSMFERGGTVYVAFANLARIPSYNSLINCMNGDKVKGSPGVVAYPITSIKGAEHKYNSQKQKYEVYAPKGSSEITVNVGTSILKDSFDKGDRKGFYQAILSLTEADI